MTANEAPPPHISPAASKGRDEYMNDVSNPNHLRPDDNMIIDSAAPGAAPMAGQVGMVDWTVSRPVNQARILLNNIFLFQGTRS